MHKPLLKGFQLSLYSVLPLISAVRALEMKSHASGGGGGEVDTLVVVALRALDVLGARQGWIKPYVLRWREVTTRGNKRMRK